MHILGIVSTWFVVLVPLAVLLLVGYARGGEDGTAE